MSNENEVVSSENTTVSLEDTKKELTEQEQAYVYLAGASKHFKNLAYKLADTKKRSVARVLEAILFDPFIDVQLLGKNEVELLAFCQNIMYYRNIAVKDVMDKNPDMFKTKEGEK